MRLVSRRLIPGLVSIAIVVLGGLYAKRYYQGPGAGWVRDSLGGVFYEILWCLVFGLLLPRHRPGRIAVGVLVATCVLEFLQLWHPAFLEWLRGFFVGRTILGSYFDWVDFLYYFVGSGLGWVWVRELQRQAGVE